MTPPPNATCQCGHTKRAHAYGHACLATVARDAQGRPVVCDCLLFRAAEAARVTG